MRGGKHYSKTAPKPSQLTRSEFWGAVYSLGEEYAHTPELICDVESNVDDIKNRLQELADETQGKLDNMPQGLQDGDTGQLMQERISAIEDAISSLDSLDVLALVGVSPKPAGDTFRTVPYKTGFKIEFRSLPAPGCGPLVGAPGIKFLVRAVESFVCTAAGAGEVTGLPICGGEGMGAGLGPPGADVAFKIG